LIALETKVWLGSIDNLPCDYDCIRFKLLPDSDLFIISSNWLRDEVSIILRMLTLWSNMFFILHVFDGSLLI
jgi:hypothetical protein